jgi:hypothetical protein
MTHPNQPSSDEADRDKETTPGGIAESLEDKAEELGATTGPGDADSDPDSPGATIDDEEPSEPNEPA